MQELNRILFSAIEASLVGTSGKDLIGTLYHGTLVNQVRKTSGNDLIGRLYHGTLVNQVRKTSGKDLIGRLYHGTLVNQVRKYSQTCIKRSPLGQRKSGLIRQETS